eukprot:m51a1_g13910 putative serine-threonine protein (1906) ;mRNA; r:772429-786691
MSLVDNPFMWSTEDIAEPVLVIGSGRETLARIWKCLRSVAIITRSSVKVTADVKLSSDVPADTAAILNDSQTPKDSTDDFTDAVARVGAHSGVSISRSFSGAVSGWKPAKVHVAGDRSIVDSVINDYDGCGYHGVAAVLCAYAPRECAPGSFSETHGTGGGYGDCDELLSQSYLSAGDEDVTTDVVAEKPIRATFVQLAERVVQRISYMMKMREGKKTTDGDVAAVQAAEERCSPDSLDVVASVTPASVPSSSVPTSVASPAVPGAVVPAEPSVLQPQQREDENNDDTSELDADAPETSSLLPGARDEPSFAVDRSAYELRVALEAARKAMAAEVAVLRKHVADLVEKLRQSEERGQALVAASSSRAVEAGQLRERVRGLDAQLAEQRLRSRALEEAHATATAERDGERVLARAAGVLLRESGGAGLLGRAVVVRGLRGDPAVGALCRLVLPSGPEAALPRRRRSSAPKPPEPVRLIALSPGNALCVFARAADAVAAASLIAGAPLVDITGTASEVGAWVVSDLLRPRSVVRLGGAVEQSLVSAESVAAHTSYDISTGILEFDESEEGQRRLRVRWDNILRAYHSVSSTEFFTGEGNEYPARLIGIGEFGNGVNVWWWTYRNTSFEQWLMNKTTLVPYERQWIMNDFSVGYLDQCRGAIPAGEEECWMPIYFANMWTWATFVKKAYVPNTTGPNRPVWAYILIDLVIQDIADLFAGLTVPRGVAVLVDSSSSILLGTTSKTVPCYKAVGNDFLYVLVNETAGDSTDEKRVRVINDLVERKYGSWRVLTQTLSSEYDTPSDPEVVTVGGVKCLVSFTRIKRPCLSFVVAVLSEYDSASVDVVPIIVATCTTGIALVVLGVLSLLLTRPLSKLSHRMNQAAHLKFNSKRSRSVGISIFSEFHQLDESFKKLSTGIEAMTKFVPMPVVSQIMMSSMTAAGLSPEGLLAVSMKRVTIMFCDIKGFTTMSEQFKAQLVVQMLYEWLGAFTKVIVKNDGIVDKYIGDPEVKACTAALEFNSVIEMLNTKFIKDGIPNFGRDGEHVLARAVVRECGGSGLLGRAVVVRGLRGDPAVGALCRLVGPEGALPRRRRSSAPKPPEPVRVIALSPGNALCVFARAADADAVASLIAGAPLVASPAPPLVLLCPACPAGGVRAPAAPSSPDWEFATWINVVLAGVDKPQAPDIDGYCRMRSQVCTSAGNRIVELTLTDRSMRFEFLGPLPLSGVLLDQLSLLTALTTLTIGDLPKVTGTIPPLDKLVSLKSLSIRNVGTHGPMPALAAGSSSLETMYGHCATMDYAGLNGTVREDVARLPSLQSLSLSHNDLTGTLPPLLALTSLADISSTNLEGEAPVLYQGAVCNISGTRINATACRFMPVPAASSLSSLPGLLSSSSGGRPPSPHRTTTAAVIAGVVVACAFACLLGIVRLRQRRASARPEEKREFALSPVGQSSSIASDLASAISSIPAVDRVVLDSEATGDEYWAVQPLRVGFDLHGEQAKIGKRLSQSIEVVNRKCRHFHYQLLPPPSNKFTVSAEPREGFVRKGHSASVVVSAVLHCTVSVDQHVVVVATYEGPRGVVVKEHKRVRIVACGKLSTRLDYDELEFGPVIGEGTFGTVYKGRWRGTDVAIKQIRSGMFLSIEELSREIDILEHIRNPYVVDFYGAAILPMLVYLVSEYVQYGSLSAVVRDYELSGKFCLHVACDIAEGMKFLHTSGILHRDLKLDNILVVALDVGCSVVCKIADFGTSRTVAGKNASLSMTVDIGTPMYMAPETFSVSSGQYSTACDVYSYSMILWGLWNKREPFSGDKYRELYLLSDFVAKGGRPEIAGDFDPQVAELVVQCWDTDPRRRPTFTEIAARVRALYDTRPNDSPCAVSKKAKLASARAARQTAPAATLRADDRPGAQRCSNSS